MKKIHPLRKSLKNVPHCATNNKYLKINYLLLKSTVAHPQNTWHTAAQCGTRGTVAHPFPYPNPFFCANFLYSSIQQLVISNQ